MLLAPSVRIICTFRNIVRHCIKADDVKILSGTHVNQNSDFTFIRNRVLAISRSLTSHLSEIEA